MRSLGAALTLRRLLKPAVIRLRNRHLLLFDVLLLTLTPLLSLSIILDGSPGPSPRLAAIAGFTLLSMAVRLVSLWACGLYTRYWLAATAEDLAHLALATVISTSIIFAAVPLATSSGLLYLDVPRYLPLLDGLLSLFALGAPRSSLRIFGRTGDLNYKGEARPALIIGAGFVGERIARELRMSPQLGLKAVGFLDDDPEKQGLRIHNLPVLGPRSILHRVVAEYDIAQVIIALPNASGKVMRQTLAQCEEAGVQAKTVPPLSEILNGSVLVGGLRKVEIEDVLRREPIHTNIDEVRKLVSGQRVLITGAGGSIGSELCRQVFACGPAEIGLLGHGENSIFDIYNELRRAGCPGEAYVPNGKTPGLRPIIADIRSAIRMNRVVAEFRPDIILHAAAHKHVPLMQENPTEAVSNNILGTKNLVDAALAHGVEHLVMISTDKVVNPTSYMGASKRAAEMVVLQAARQSGRHYVAVRFGNVLGSRGSVVPIFKKQIAAGGPVTVSHPEMTRYFITIPEAVQLVLQAAVLGRGGEIFMLDMGEPVKIVDLARDLIELSGLEVGRDIDIVYSGIRPGEKLKEELFVRGEVYEPTRHEKIRIVKNAGAFVSEMLDELIEAFRRSVDEDDPKAALETFSALLPTVPGMNGAPPEPDVTMAAVPDRRRTHPELLPERLAN
jgi:FlaA1/EpsC-like NDP-sugar epimerase